MTKPRITYTLLIDDGGSEELHEVEVHATDDQDAVDMATTYLAAMPETFQIVVCRRSVQVQIVRRLN